MSCNTGRGIHHFHGHGHCNGFNAHARVHNSHIVNSNPGAPCIKGNKKKVFLCFIATSCCPFIMFLLIVGTILGVTSTSNQSRLPVNMEPLPVISFGPGETRIVPFNTSFLYCGDLNLRIITPLRGRSISLFLIGDEPPHRATPQRFNISIRSNFLNTVSGNRNWQFYLNAGSSVSIRLCVAFSFGTSRLVAFEIIQGTSNSFTIQSVVRRISLTISECQTIEYQVQIEDNYSFKMIVSRTRLPVYGSFSLNMEFSRVQYSTASVGSAPNCVVRSPGNCSVDVPVGSTGKALITTGLAEPVDWKERYQVSLMCGNRSWAIAVTALIPILLLILIIIIATVIVCVCCKAKLKQKKATLTPTEDPDPLTKIQQTVAIPPAENDIDSSLPIQQELVLEYDKLSVEFVEPLPPSYQDIIKSATVPQFV